MAERELCSMLGELLLASKAIGPKELREALRREGESGRSVGDILIDMGALEPRQLERAVETQARLRGGRDGPQPFVLLVDDDVEVGALVRDVLEGAGYRVGVAQNEEEVLAAVLASDGVSPQLLVLDLGLPGNGGIELLATLRSNPSTRDMLVVVLTGHPDMESKIHARGLKISRFLVKPVPVRQLVEVVDEVVREAEPARQAVRF